MSTKSSPLRGKNLRALNSPTSKLTEVRSFSWLLSSTSEIVFNVLASETVADFLQFFVMLDQLSSVSSIKNELYSRIRGKQMTMLEKTARLMPL